MTGSDNMEYTVFDPNTELGYPKLSFQILAYLKFELGQCATPTSCCSNMSNSDFSK